MDLHRPGPQQISRESRQDRLPAPLAVALRSAAGIALGALLFCGCAIFSGCASPGPPRSPSLNLPQPVSDLAATLSGNQVELRFTVPHLSTDKLPLYEPRRHRTSLSGVICRALPPAPCTPVARIEAPLTAADHTPFTWREDLPTDLSAGPPRLLLYRVEFLSPAAKSAGPSDPAYTAAGAPPAPVTGLRITGSRSGTLLQWTPSSAPGDILLHRIDVAPRPFTPDTKKGTGIRPFTAADDLWLNANSTQSRTLDATVAADTLYRYTAARRLPLTLSGHTVELRSDPSPAIDFTLHPIYPPAVPSGLDATGFTPPPSADTHTAPHFAIDLIWQPVSDAGITPSLAAPLLGYHVYREQLEAGGTTPRTRLTTTPTPEPSFHDPTAEPTLRYRYSVTSIDAAHNESQPATITVEATPQ